MLLVETDINFKVKSILADEVENLEAVSYTRKIFLDRKQTIRPGITQHHGSSKYCS